MQNKMTMYPNEMNETREFWDRIADDWNTQVGDHGDSNRILNSDPVLWAFAGDVAGLTVLDAGCGTGYLTRQLQERGALVRGVDFSEKMCQIARAKAPELDFRVDSCCSLTTVDDGSIDMVIANYVLMDLPDLDEAMRAFDRVLRVDGLAIAIFSHPCFPQGRATTSHDSNQIAYDWDFAYFERQRCVDPPWGHFDSEFIWFHRPLSDYWKAFKRAGFQIVDFDEPRVSPERYHLIEDPRRREAAKTRPYSVAFKLRKHPSG